LKVNDTSDERVGESAKQKTSMKCRQHFPTKSQLDFNELHGNISQKRELLITTAVRTSDSKKLLVFGGNINVITLEM
jgi:hypothetical protein